MDTIRQPKGLWYIATSFAIMSFGFGLLVSLLVLYVTQRLNFSTKQAYTLFATFNTLLYILPLYSGRLADWFGYKRAFCVGLGLVICALFLLSVPNKYMMFFALSLFIVGASTNSPAFLVLQGKLYAKTDMRRESGFTLSYMIMNFSYLLSSIVGGYIQQSFSFSDSFLVAACVSFFAIVVYLLGNKFIVPHPERNIKARLQGHSLVLTAGLLIMALLPLVVCYFALLKADTSSHIVLYIGIVVVIGILILALSQKEAVNRYRLIAFLLLSIISIGFWSLYMLEPSLLTIFIKNNVDRHLFGSQIPPSVFYGLNPFYIVTVGWLFSALWIYLRKRNKDLSIPSKFSISLLIMASGFLSLVIAINFAGANGKVPLEWILFVYLFFTTGELMISPIGNAMVGRLSPEGLEGFLMGVWQFFTGLSATISASLAKLAVVPKTGTALTTNPIYAKAFTKIGLFTLAIAVIALILLPFIKKAIAHGHETTQ